MLKQLTNEAFHLYLKIKEIKEAPFEKAFSIKNPVSSQQLYRGLPHQRCLLWIIFIFNCCLSLPTLATTYAVTSTAFNWIDASIHTKLGPTTGGIYSSLYAFTNPGGCGTSPPVMDDTISNNIPMGFTFTYGVVGFTSVRIMSNGRIQFNNNATCGFGSPVTQLPYPDSSLTYSMRIYGNDLDPSLQSEISGYTTTCVSRSSCYISYSTIGSAPNRSFVITYNNIPEWTTLSSATGNYNLQLIIQESGGFIYQYGTHVSGPQASLAQIGWEISTADYAIAPVGLPTNNTALLFYIPNPGTVVAPGAFNAFDTSTWGGSTTGILGTKIAGTPFTLDVVALNSPPSVLTNFIGTVKVELVDATSSASCSAMTSIQSVTSSYTFVAADKGRHTFSGISQINAYPNVQVRISSPATSPTRVVCATDAFAIRPNNFVVVATDTTWTTAGTTRTLNASTTTGTPIHKSGQPFTLSVTPYNSLGTTVSNVTSTYNGNPLASFSCALPASNCVAGVFSTGTFTQSSGVSTFNSANYSEVGAINLIMSDSNFAKIDAADGTSSSQLTINSTPITIGRFIPDHLVTSLLSNGNFAHSCSTFTYNGQPLNYASTTHPMLNVSAYNGLSPATVTKNYTGSLNHLLASQFTLTAPTTDAAKKGVDNSNLVKLIAALDVPILTDYGNGNLTLKLGNDIFTYQRENNALIAPFSNAIAITVSNVTDSDGVTSTTLPMVLQPSGENIYYGRVNLINANDSELLDLPMPLTAEYWNGSSWVKNTADQCTTGITLSAAQVIGPITTLCAWDTGIGTGSSGLGCSVAGTSINQFIQPPLITNGGDFNLSFKAPGTGNTGAMDVTATVPSYLKFNWKGAGNTNPIGRATFGIYKGNSHIIYIREVY